MPSLLIDDFSGGLNLRDSLNQLAPNETPDNENFTLDERGSLQWRHGIEDPASLPGVSTKKAYIFYSAALDQWLCARETSHAPNSLCLHTRPGDLSGSWTDRGAINTSVSAQAAFIDFPGNPPKVVVTTDINTGATRGVWTWDGTTLTNVSNAVAGNAIALWQDKAWICGYPTSDANGHPTRLFYSAPKDPATWGATTQFTDIREKDAATLTALGLAGGALIVFKKRSAYRVNDSATGAYSTLDSARGCVNPRVCVPVRGRLYVWGADGMFEVDGSGPLLNVGDKIRPVYATADTTILAAGSFGDHVIAANMAVASGELIEFSPGVGWIVAHSISGDVFSSFALKDTVLYAANQTRDRLYRIFTGSPGDDNGTVIAGKWRTPWFKPNGGLLSQLHRVRVEGATENGTTANVQLSVYKDWAVASPDTFDLGDLLRGTAEQRSVDLQSLGHGYAFAFTFTTTTADSGAIAVRAIQLFDIPLSQPSVGYPHASRRGSTSTPPTPPPPAA